MRECVVVCRAIGKALTDGIIKLGSMDGKVKSEEQARVSNEYCLSDWVSDMGSKPSGEATA